MTDHPESCDKILKDKFLQLNEPILLKNALSNHRSKSWKLLDWSLENLADKLEDKKLPFRVGQNCRTITPQWEVDTPIENKTLREFLYEVNENKDPSKWFYFDYKYMREWFNEKSDILKSVNWQPFGFELDGSDSTMWIGSKGAHTNCHQDTYGCNLVSQVHGKKLWLLFSPNCTNLMEPTRTPYEESTIFSKYNFFTPSEKELEALQSMTGSVKIIILEPKDVLFIPRGWWHYVESLETSLSVNVWIPVVEDCNSRLKETLVHLIANTIGEDIPKTVNQQESNLLESIQLLEISLRECKKFSENQQLLKNEKKVVNNNSNAVEYLKTKFHNQVEIIPNLTSANMNVFLEKNTIDKNIEEKENVENNEPTKLDILEAVVDAFCHPEVTQKVSEILKNRFIKKSENIL